MFLVALRLGLTSFGGPVAHLGYYRREYVQRRRWLDEETFADLIGLFSFVPGPTSTQITMSVGLLRAGVPGALVAWLGFTLPSAILMIAFAYALDRLGGALVSVTRVLEVVALVVVAIAVWQMARRLAWDARRGAIAIASAAIILASPEPNAQLAVIALAALVGRLALPAPAVSARAHHAVPIGRWAAASCGALFLGLLLLLPLARATIPNGELRLVDSFYRSGALVFGGGHVVLPLLRAEVVPAGWVSEDRFLAGYGAAQAVPGPLFTFAAYLGAIIEPVPPVGDLTGPWPPNGIAGATLATLAISLPGALLVFAALPSWGALRARAWAQSSLRGVNAAVVGLLLAALITLARTAIASLVG